MLEETGSTVILPTILPWRALVPEFEKVSHRKLLSRPQQYGARLPVTWVSPFLSRETMTLSTLVRLDQGMRALISELLHGGRQGVEADMTRKSD
jgi:hypothetical protein